MLITRGRVSNISEVTVDGDIDFLSTYQVLNLASPASGEALRKGNKDIANAELADAAAIAGTKLALTGHITNAMVNGSANIAESKLSLDKGTQANFDKVGTDISTHSSGAGEHHAKTIDASELSTGTLPLARIVNITNNEVAAGALLVPDSTVGDHLEIANDVERNTQTTSYVKLKETYIARPGVWRVKFAIKTDVGGNFCYGLIYKNGSAIGIGRSHSSTSFTEYSEDISGLARGDLLQIYCKHQYEGQITRVRNFRCYTANPLQSTTII